MPSEKIKTFGENTVFERPAQPIELAKIFVFLASEDASYVSGEIYGATGGRTPCMKEKPMDFFDSLAICFLGATHKTGQLVDRQKPSSFDELPHDDQRSLHPAYTARIIPKHFSSCRIAAFCFLRASKVGWLISEEQTP